jgi:hypothetical protein
MAHRKKQKSFGKLTASLRGNYWTWVVDNGADRSFSEVSYGTQKLCKEVDGHWDKKHGVCRLRVKPISKLLRNRKAYNNVTSAGKDITIDDSSNVIVSGKSHKIENAPNSVVYGGTHAKVQNAGSVVQGGGGFGNDRIGACQVEHLTFYALTTDATQTNTTDIQLEKNTIYTYTFHLNRLQVGGSSGVVGDHYSWEGYTGSIHVDNTLTLGFHNNTGNTSTSGGSSGSFVLDYADTSLTKDGLISLKVTGEANKNLQWFGYMTLIKNQADTSI